VTKKKQISSVKNILQSTQSTYQFQIEENTRTEKMTEALPVTVRFFSCLRRRTVTRIY